MTLRGGLHRQGRTADVCAYADRIVIRQDGETVGEHPRSFERNKVIYNPWHYVPILKRKPGALRNGAPFRDWALPKALRRVRARVARHEDGDRRAAVPKDAQVTLQGH